MLSVLLLLKCVTSDVHAWHCLLAYQCSGETSERHTAKTRAHLCHQCLTLMDCVNLMKAWDHYLDIFPNLSPGREQEKFQYCCLVCSIMLVMGHGYCMSFLCNNESNLERRQKRSSENEREATHDGKFVKF